MRISRPSRTRRMVWQLWLVAASMLLGLSVGRAGETVGKDCVQPLDLVSPYQDLSNCNLKGVTVDGNVPVPGGNPLYGSNLSGANLNGATIIGGYKPLQYANLDGANLRGATIGGGPNELAPLQGASLRFANLNGAAIAGFRALSLTDLTGANLHGSTVTGSEAFQGAFYDDTTCPDGTNSDDDGGTCIGHGVPA